MNEIIKIQEKLMTDKYKYCNLKTHLIIVTFILFSISNGFGQSDIAQKDINDSISLHSKQLTGRWEFIGYYKNNQFVETLISTSFSATSDGLKEEKILTDSGLICKKYIHDTLISVDKLITKDVIELRFEPNGRGSYQHYLEYYPDSDIQTIVTCQPIPEIVYKAGRYMINFVSMGGEYDSYFEINGDTLRLDSETERIRLYLRLKDKAL